jgi:hypothetical protein
MVSPRRKSRAVYLATRTINELGENTRGAFKAAQILTGRNFSVLMHWSVVVGDSLFELGGSAKSRVHSFTMKPVTVEIEARFQLKQFRGYTSMTDEEILSAGTWLSKIEVLLSESC